MADYKGKMPVKNDGIYDGSVNDEPSSAAIVASERNAAIDHTTLNKRPTAKAGDEDKIALDVSLSDGDANSINKNNPLPVYISDSPSTEIQDYDVQEVIKDGGLGNHDYITGAEFRALHVEAGSSELAKFELQIETGVAAGTYDTVMSKFNSVSMPQVEFALRNPKPVLTGITIRLVKTNLGKNHNTDMYSVINGLEV